MAVNYPWCAVCGHELTEQEIRDHSIILSDHFGLTLCSACEKSCKETTAMIADYNRQRELAESNRTETGRRIAEQETAGRMVPVKTTSTFGGFMETIYIKYNDLANGRQETKTNKFWGADVFMAGEHLSPDDLSWLKRLNVKW